MWVSSSIPAVEKTVIVLSATRRRLCRIWMNHPVTHVVSSRCELRTSAQRSLTKKCRRSAQVRRTLIMLWSMKLWLLCSTILTVRQRPNISVIRYQLMVFTCAWIYADCTVWTCASRCSDRLRPASDPDPCDAPSLWVFPICLKGKGFAAFCGSQLLDTEVSEKHLWPIFTEVRQAECRFLKVTPHWPRCIHLLLRLCAGRTDSFFQVKTNWAGVIGR